VVAKAKLTPFILCIYKKIGQQFLYFDENNIENFTGAEGELELAKFPCRGHGSALPTELLLRFGTGSGTRTRTAFRGQWIFLLLHLSMPPHHGVCSLDYVFTIPFGLGICRIVSTPLITFSS